MQFWHCPLMLIVSLIAAINTEQTPSQRLEPNQGLEQQDQPQQMQEQPSQSDNKVWLFPTLHGTSWLYVPSNTGRPTPAVTNRLEKRPARQEKLEPYAGNVGQKEPGCWRHSGCKIKSPSPVENRKIKIDLIWQLAKRAWSDLTQHGWGKRSWTQLHGAWGKRRWDQLHGAWGKRSDEEDQLEENDADMDNNKRSGWNKMQGVWGKRSADNDLMIDDDGHLFQLDEDQVDKTVQVSFVDSIRQKIPS